MLNAGKSIPSNCSSNEEWVTALDTVGMMCDTTEECVNTDGTAPWPSDMVGTCSMNDISE